MSVMYDTGGAGRGRDQGTSGAEVRGRAGADSDSRYDQKLGLDLHSIGVSLALNL